MPGLGKALYQARLALSVGQDSVLTGADSIALLDFVSEVACGVSPFFLLKCIYWDSYNPRH